MDALQKNARDLQRELDWLARVLEARFRLYFGEPCDYSDVSEISPPPLSADDSEYARLIGDYALTYPERLALILALTPHIRPQLLDVLHTRNKTFDRRFTEFGGTLRGNMIIPTGETIAFLIGGDDLEHRFRAQFLIDPTHPLIRNGIIVPDPDFPSQPVMQTPLGMTEDTIARLTSGRAWRPAFGAHFPAQFIESSATWDDLVLHPRTLAQVEEIETWITYGSKLMDDWGMRAKLRPGIRCLFHGPPGTGKTMTAELIGQSTGRDVYKIDLSLVVSKYIGETEKNLARVFDQAQSKGWILFFDEADALFGRRVESRDAHDRYANQEVAFLLQRIETFDGVAILASNMKDDIDDAFLRRFETIVYFPMPRPEERVLLWRKGLPPKARLAKDLDLEALAHDHELTGGAVMNAIRFASLRAIADGERPIAESDLVTGIRRELAKEGKVG